MGERTRSTWRRSSQRISATMPEFMAAAYRSSGAETRRIFRVRNTDFREQKIDAGAARMIAHPDASLRFNGALWV